MFERVVEHAPWAARAYHKVLAHKGRLVLFSGRASGTYLADAWETGNGEDWTQVSNQAAPGGGGIGSFGACVHDNRIFVSNGLPDMDSWVGFSPDAIHGVQLPDASWEGRYDGEMCSFDQRLWLIGGEAVGGNRNDVWWSRDGSHWTQALANGHTMWTPRMDHRVVVHAGKMWIIGGIDDNGPCSDVWYSDDGVRWIQANTNAPFGAIYNHAVVSYGPRLVVVTGTQDFVDEHKLWHSLDGVLWEGGQDTEFSARGEFAMEVFDNRIYVFGGEHGGNAYNDVWRTVGEEF